MNSPQKDRPVDDNLTREFYVARAQAAFFVIINRWGEAKQSFEKAFEIARKIMHVIVFARKDYAWALTKQGRTDDAKIQLEENQKTYAEIENKFARVNVQAFLMAPSRAVAGEEFEMRLDLVNVSKKSGVLLNVKGLLLPELTITSPQANCRLENGSVDIMNGNIGAFNVETLKFALETSRTGVLTLNPQVTYIDELGETKISKPNSITVTVQPAKPRYEILPGRIPTGFAELDALLLGGVPQNCAVVLTSASTDERELLIKKFLEAGAKADEIAFYITAEAGTAKTVTEKYPSNFYLFICNPQGDIMVQNLPNVFKLRGVENLTDIDIALMKAFRTLDPSRSGPKRICIEIYSISFCSTMP